MINQVKIYLEQQNELILREKKYLIRFFKSNSDLFFTFFYLIPDKSEFTSIEFGMENTNKGHIYLKNKMAKIMTFTSFKNLIEKLNELELLKETHEKILKKVLKFLKENNIKEQQIKNWSVVK